MRLAGYALALSLVTTAQLAQVPNADLQVRKILTRPAQFDLPAQFAIVVTNLGPQPISTPITIRDTFAGGSVTVGGGNKPWICKPPSGTNVVCTHPGPLAPGHSIVVTPAVSSNPGPGDYQNCVTVEAAVNDANPANNKACACVTFYACRDVEINVSTGRSSSGVALSSTKPDPNWQLISLPPKADSQPGPANLPLVVEWNPVTQSARWISGRTAAPSYVAATTPGTYIYEFRFVLSPEWEGRKCKLSFRYSADNTVVFTLNGQPVASNLNAATLNETLQPLVTHYFAPASGPPYVNKLQAEVRNLAASSGLGTVTGLFVDGTITCTCNSTEPVNPRDPTVSYH
jgi:Domain of unknown function DUF11